MKQKTINLKSWLAMLFLLFIGVGTVAGETASVGTTLWAENFAHFGTNTPSDAGTGTGTTIYGGVSITYDQSSISTKGYNENIAKGTAAPELLLAKTTTSTPTQTWTISGIPTGGATEMTLTFVSNNNSGLTVSSPTSGISVGTLSKKGTAAPYHYTVDISVTENVSLFNLVISNTTTSNKRIDDFVLKVKTAGTISPSDPCTVTFVAGLNGTCPVSSRTEDSAGAGVQLPEVTPNSGYRFKGWSTSEATYTAVSLTSGVFKPTSDCTLYAFYSQEHSAKFYVDGVQSGDTQNLIEGETIEFPADPSLDGVSFMGWATATIDGTQDDAPVMYKSATMGTNNVEYFAVFATASGSGNDEWVEITTTPDAGTYAICSASYFMKAEVSSNRFANGSATPSIVDGKLTTAPAEDCIWNITKPDKYFRIQNGTKYACGTSSKNQGALLTSATDNLEKWSISYVTDHFEIINYGRSQAKTDSGNKYLRNNTTSGWATYTSGTGSAPRLFKKVSDTTYAGYCTSFVTKYDVTFNLQGHGEAVAPQAIAEGETVAEPAAPTAMGYTFGGWHKDAECTNAWNFSTDVMGTSAITLFAKWTATNYSITYNNVEDATHSNPATYTIETATINLADASKDGYIFQGWFDNDNYTGDAVTTIAQGSTGNKTFWAKWAEVPVMPCVVTFNVGELGICATASATEASVGAGVPLPDVTANDGWVFKGWSTANPATAETLVSTGDDGKYHPLSDTQLYAYYKVKPATPFFSESAGAIEKGTEVTISCSTEGAVIYYTTNGDEPTAESAVYSEAIMVSEAKAIKAIAVLDNELSDLASAEYTIAQHTAQFSINGVITAGNNNVVAKGEAITFPADPAAPEEHVFIGWKKGGEEVTTPQDDAIATVDKAVEVMGTEDVTYFAVWAVENRSVDANYQLVESALDNWAGDYLIVYNNTYAMNSHSGNQNANTFATYTDISEFYAKETKSIAANNTTDALVYRAAATTNGYSLYCLSDESYLGITANTTSTGTKLRWNTSYTESADDWTFGVGSIGNVGSNTLYIRWNNNSGSYRFAAYASDGQQAIQLFKKNAGSSYSDYSTKVVTREICDIAVKTAPTTVDYCEGENFDPAGLEITVNYTEGDPEDVTYFSNEAKFSFSPALDAELIADNDLVDITYKGKTCQQSINVRTVCIAAPVTVEGSYTVKVGDAEAVTADGNTIAAKKGQTVVLASTPASGYKLASTPFVVKDEDENEVSVSTAGGQYSFIMPGKNVAITAQFSPVYSIIAGSCDHGSITAIKDKDGVSITETSSRSKVVVEATADEHYHLTGMYYVKEGEETKNVISENESIYSFSMPQSNVTVFAEFVEDEKFTAIWMANGTEIKSEDVYGDVPVTAPAVESQYGKVFCGWVEEQIDGMTNTRPSFTDVSSMTLSEDKTFYAVFATASAGASATAEGTADFSSSVPDGWTCSGTVTYFSKPIGMKEANAYIVNKNIPDFKNHSSLASTITIGVTSLQNGGTGSELTIYLVDTDGKVIGTGKVITPVNTSDASKVTRITVDFDAANAAGYMVKCTTFEKSILITASDYSITYIPVDYSDYCTDFATIALNAACNDGGKVYSTYSNASAWVVPENLTVSEVGIDEGKLSVNSYETGAVVPANTGVMVAASAGGYYTVALSKASGTSVLGSGNCLRPSGAAGITADAMGAADAGCTYYRLTMHNGSQIGFWWGAADGAAFALAANKAYLAVPKSAGVKASIWFGMDDEDALDNIQGSAEDACIYNVQGQRIQKMQRGINIVNGKKVLK